MGAILDIDDVEKLPRSALVQYYLMAGWLYESRNTSMMTDPAWDRLCARVDAAWDTLTHPHKKYIDRDALASATAMYLQDEHVPLMARGAAVHLMGGGIDPGVSNILTIRTT